MVIKKKDKVLVLAGKDRGKTGEVLKTFPDKNTAIVAKINIVKKHMKSTKEKPGGIVTLEAPVNASRLMLVCAKCNQPTRPKNSVLADGSGVRACRKCGEQIL